MRGRTLLIALVTLGSVLPGVAMAQAEQIIQLPNGTVIQNTSRLPAGRPDLDVAVTGSIGGARVLRAVPSYDAGVAVDRRGCDVQSYVVGPGERVRVHRC